MCRNSTTSSSKPAQPCAEFQGRNHRIKSELGYPTATMAQVVAVLLQATLMILSHGVAPSRRKAVWGPKRTLALVALLVFGLSPSAFAAGHHRSSARKAAAGRPNSQ